MALDTRNLPTDVIEHEQVLIDAIEATRKLLRIRRAERNGDRNPAHSDLWGTVSSNAGILAELCRDLRGTLRS